MNISYRTIARLSAVALAFLLVMSVQVVVASHQLKDGRSQTLTLKPKKRAGGATGQIEIKSARIDDFFNDDRSLDNNGDFNDGTGSLDDDTGGFDGNGDFDNGDGFDNGDFGNDGLDDDTGDFDQDGNENGDDFNDNGDDFNDNRDDRNGQVDEVQVTGNVQIDNLADRAGVEAFLVDNEGGQSINLGELTEDGTQLRLRFNDTVNNLEDFDRVVITREAANDTDSLPGGDVLLTAALPH